MLARVRQKGSSAPARGLRGIGTFLERADNTARLIEVKFHALTGGEYFGPTTNVK